MYNKIVIGNAGKEISLEQYDTNLRKLGRVEFISATKKELTLIRSSATMQDYLINFFHISIQRRSHRWSNRYNRFLTTNITHNNANRSIVDMFLTALSYCPQFADFRSLYIGLMEWYIHCSYLNHSVCPTIRRRVWAYRGVIDITVMKNSISKDPVRTIHSYSPTNARTFNTVDEIGTNITFDLNSDPKTYSINVRSEDKILPQQLGIKPA